jgi:hypothetical protein
MFHEQDRTRRLALASERLNAADTTTAQLVTIVIAAASNRLAGAAQGRREAQIENFVNAGAWIDAATVLLETGLPRWRLRRLAYDDGEWHCAISCQRALPDWLDQAIETRHPDLSVAILKGVVEAMRLEDSGMHANRPSTQRADLRDLLCCDNFA